MKCGVFWFLANLRFHLSSTPAFPLWNPIQTDGFFKEMRLAQAFPNFIFVRNSGSVPVTLRLDSRFPFSDDDFSSRQGCDLPKSQTAFGILT